MSKKITVTTQKGGNGKTSVSLNVAFEFGKLGKKVLLLDIDPQGSLGKNTIGEEILPGHRGIEELFLNDSIDPVDLVLPTKMENVSIIPSHSSLSGVPAKLLYDGDGFFTLKYIVSKLDTFDYIIIDTPGSLEYLTLSSFIASDYLIIPIYPALYSLLAINELTTAISRMKKNFNADVEVLGVVITMLDCRANLYKEFVGEVKGFFGDKLFTTSTSRTVKSEEATLNSIGVSGMYPECKLAYEYRSLTREILNRLEKKGV